MPHAPFKAMVGQRLVGWISSHDDRGRLNLAPYSFFAFSYTPPSLVFPAPVTRTEWGNVEKIGEFGWNLATKPLVEAINASCAKVAPEVDEFELAQLTPVASCVISVPRVAETPVSFECQVSQIVKGADGTNANSWLVLGEVVGMHIARYLLVDGIYDTAAAQPILRAGGPANYFEIDPAHLFKMYRPGDTGPRRVAGCVERFIQ